MKKKDVTNACLLVLLWNIFDLIARILRLAKMKETAEKDDVNQPYNSIKWKVVSPAWHAVVLHGSEHLLNVLEVLWRTVGLNNIAKSEKIVIVGESALEKMIVDNRVDTTD